MDSSSVLTASMKAARRATASAIYPREQAKTGNPALTWPQALFMGLLQGATELFPVSSLGHAVLIPSLLHWSFKQSDPSFVPFLVLLHLGTAGALLVVYRTQWVDIIKGFFTAAVRGRIERPSERLAMLLLVGTIPAGILGVFLEHELKSLFASPEAAAIFLVVNGFLMLGFEALRRRAEARVAPDARSRVEQEESFAAAEQISFKAAALVGACQALALLHGISRSGVTIGGGLLAGLYYEGVLQIFVSDTHAAHHTTHAVLFGVLAIASLIGANFARSKRAV